MQQAEEHITADFLPKDINMDGKWHLLFATPNQLDHLSDAKTWYVDATSKIVQAPLTQLLSVHTFVKADGATKQMALASCLMSGWEKKE